MSVICYAKSDAEAVQAELLVDRLTLGTSTGDVPYSKLLWGADGGGSAVVSQTSGLPVQAAAGTVWPVSQYGSWTVGLTAGTTVGLAPGTTVGVWGTVAVTQSGGWIVDLMDGAAVAVLGTVAVSQSGPWSVAVSAVGGTVTVTGTVAVSAVAGTVTVGGTVAATQSGPWGVSVLGTPTVAVQGEVDVRPAVPAAGDYLPVRLTDGSNFYTATGGGGGGGDVNLIGVGGAAIGLGQKLMTASLPVVLASNQSAVPVSGTVTANQGGAWTVTANAGTGTFTVGGTVAVSSVGGTVTVAGTVTANAGTGTFQVGGTVAVSSVGGTVAVTQSGAWSVTANAGTGTFTVGDGGGSLTVDSPQLPATLGQKTAAASLAVVLASDHAAVPVQPAAAATATLTNVGASATSVQLLAANPARKGATCYNDSAAELYLKLGTTASATSFTVRLGPFAYFEIPFGFTGRVDGIWSSPATGAGRLTELS
jgi:hypothetical protein